MQLRTGLGGGFALAAWPGAGGTATNGNPAGPQTAAQAGFGVTASSQGGQVTGHAKGVLSVATLALIGLVWIWYSLPR